MAGAPSQDGFALAVVVFLLFAVGMAGALGYRVVNLEARLALQDQEAARALAVADGSLRRYVGTQMGELEDSVRYEIGGGRALVTFRRVFDRSFPDEVVLVSATGSFTDPRYPGTPAVREIRQFAEFKRSPVNVLGALATAHQAVTIEDFTISGRDAAAPGDCRQAGSSVAGVVAGGRLRIRRGGVTGSPRFVEMSSRDALIEAVEANWDFLTGPDAPVDYEGTAAWPNFSALPPDSFPVLRMPSGFTGTEARSGRGLLIVDGLFLPRDGFEWDGIILSENFGDLGAINVVEIRGLVVTGLRSGNDQLFLMDGGSILFHSCNVLDAGRKLAHLEPLAGTWWQSVF